jgi:Ca2+-binding RTX toxin-like protein
MTLRAAALGAVLALLLPATALAGNVTAGAGLTFTAGGGEANRLTVSRAGDQIVFTDVLPIAEAAPDCSGNATLTVTCAFGASVDVVLGDLDDHVTLGAIGGAVPATLDGGDGADTLDAAAATGFADLRGGDGADTLRAGIGESDLTGGPGADTLVGGPDGAFTTYLMDAAPDGPDVVAGGAGFDVAGYAARTAPLQLIANGMPSSGQAGELDAIGGAVERLEGGAGADVLAAGAGDSELSGGGGNDQLTGGPGADLLSGGEGDDGIAGGAGDDLAAPSPAIAAPGGDGAGPGESETAVDAGADAFSGGDGFDTASYESRVGAVNVTLDGVANDGEANERDNAGADVEAVLGGRGADVLTGSPRPERIMGGPGADAIDPGAGLDEVRAGDGGDTVRAEDGIGEWISCGTGADTMTGDFSDVPVACESTRLGQGPLPPDVRKPAVRISGLPARPRYRHVRRGLRPRISADERAAFVVELLGAATRAHISAAKPFNLTLVRRTIGMTSQPRRISLRPKRSLLGPRRKLRVRIRVTATDAAGNVRVVRKTLKARR